MVSGYANDGEEVATPELAVVEECKGAFECSNARWQQAVQRSIPVENDYERFRADVSFSEIVPPPKASPKNTAGLIHSPKIGLLYRRLSRWM